MDAIENFFRAVKLISLTTTRICEPTQNGTLSKSIKAWLGENKNQVNAQIQAANWYRRLGKLPEALRVLSTKRKSHPSLITDQSEDKRRLWYAFILNLLGMGSCHLLEL